MTSTTSNIAKNTIYQFVGKFSTMTITIIATLLITRFYGRELYGEFSLMQNWPAIFFIIVDFGFNAIATKELSKDFSKVNIYLGNLILIRTLFSVFFILLLWLGLYFFPYSESLKFGIRLSSFLILTQSLFTTSNIVFQTKLKYDYSTISLISGYLVLFGLILYFSLNGYSVIWVSFSYVIGGVITFLIALRYLKRLGVTPIYKFDKVLIKNLFIQTLPIGIMFIFSQLNFKEDEILLSVLKLPKEYGLNNSESVGIYSLPYKIFDVALVVPTFFMNSVYPVMVRHLQESKQKLKDTFLKSIYVLIFLGIIAGIMGVLLAPLGISILGGPQFYRSVLVLQILLGGLVLYYLTQPLSWLLVTLEKQIYLPYVYAFVAIINLILNLIFIPKYSFYAAATITHVSELLILVLLVVAVKKAWKEYYAS